MKKLLIFPLILTLLPGLLGVGAAASEDPAASETLDLVRDVIDSGYVIPGAARYVNPTVIYTRVDSLQDLPDYAAVVIESAGTLTTIGSANGRLSVAAAEVEGDALTVGMGNFLTVALRGEGDDCFDMYVPEPAGFTDYLYIDEDGALQHTGRYGPQPDGWWFLEGGVLGWNSGSGTVLYVTDADGASLTFGTEPGDAVVSFYGGSDRPSRSGGGDGNPSEIELNAEDGPQFTTQPVAVPFVNILETPDYETPVYTAGACLPEDSTADEIVFTWYVDDVEVWVDTQAAVPGKEVRSVFTAESLAGLTGAGLHRVYVNVSCTAGETTYGNNSTRVSFIACTGVIPDSELTFSDVHEIFSNIGNAIADIMAANDGRIPALIVCTGDWANGEFMDKPDAAGITDNFRTAVNSFIAVMAAQAGGIDTVYVAGNHDNAEAADMATVASGLYTMPEQFGDTSCTAVTGEDRVDSEGVICTYANSEYNDDIYDYGINYTDIVLGSADEGYSYGYDNVLDSVEAFLEDVSETDPGAIVVVHAHAGLHSLGEQPESSADPWAGDNDYNMNGSDRMVELLNRYADRLTIIFLFGHNHSKRESEFVLTPGDTITACVDYETQETKDITLGFTYGQAGYITTSQAALQRYSLLTWDADTVTRTMYTIGGTENEDLNATVDRVSPSGGEAIG